MLKLLGEEQRGFVSRVDVARIPGTFNPPRVITAVRNASGQLLLIVWDISDNGKPIARGTETAGLITEVAIAGTHNNQIVTALRDSQGELRLITWSISSNGQTITRLFTEETNIPIQAVDVGSVRLNLFHTACKNDDGNLLVSEWQVESNGNMSLLSSITFGSATEISITDRFTTSSIVAMKDSQGKLRTINFDSPLRRGGTGTGGEISRICLAHSGGKPQWITATASPGPIGVRTGLVGGGRLLVGAGLLKLIAWETNSGFDVLENPVRIAELELEGESGIAFEVAAIGDIGQTIRDIFVTVHRGVGTYRKLLARDQGKPQVTFTAWKLDNFDKKFKRLDTVTRGGTFDQLALAEAGRVTGEPGDRFVSAMRDGSQNLRLMVWDVSD